MKLTNAQLYNYVERIKFSREDKQKYQPQIDTLKENVTKYISKHTDCKVIKILQSGSWKKGTILAPKDGVELDIDLVFFIDMGTATQWEVRQLNEDIKNFLFDIYPNKTEDDFWDSPKTAGVVFRGTGLSFDIVPVVPINTESYVWQPEKGTRGHYYTSIEGQLKFNSDLKDQNNNYAAIVRILKKWKSKHDLKLSSFSIEIIQGWLDCIKGYDLSIEDAVIRFLDWLGRYEFPHVAFKTSILDKINTTSRGAIYVADPTNRNNNTAEYLSEDDWNTIQNKAREDYEKLVYAQELEFKGETVELWKEVFGTSFNIDELPQNN